MTQAEATPEFARPMPPPLPGTAERVRKISADAEERAALARRFDLLSLDRLEAEVRLQRLAGGLVRLRAHFRADVVQACIVTLDPVASCIDEDFTLFYGPVEEGREIRLDGAEELVEPLIDDTIDIGEAVAQQLSLALDPFPCAATVVPEGETPAEDRHDSPFAALRAWRKSGKAGA